MEKNPKVNVGDKIILLSPRNNQIALTGEVLTIMELRNQSYSAKTKSGTVVHLYFTNPADEYCLYTKENMIEYLNSEKKSLEDKLESISKRIDFENNYESEEEFVAEKLENLMEANSKGENKKERIALMTDILKTLKESNIL